MGSGGTVNDRLTLHEGQPESRSEWWSRQCGLSLFWKDSPGTGVPATKGWQLLTILVALLVCLPATRAQVSQPLDIRTMTKVEPLPRRGDSEQQIQEAARQRQWKQVQELAQALTRKDPRNPQGHFWLGIAWGQFHEPIKVIQSLRAAERLGLDTAMLHTALGQAYYEINQYLLFREQMEKASQLDPGDYRPLALLAHYYESDRHDYATALKLYERALQIKPDDTRTLYFQGYCRERLDNYPQAREAYERAIQLVEKNHERFGWPYQRMASMLLGPLGAGAAEALPYAQKAVAVEPDDDSHHATLATVYEQLGRTEEAIAAIQKALELKPSEVSRWYILFRLHKKVGNHEAAQAALKMFQKLDPLYR